MENKNAIIIVLLAVCVGSLYFNFKDSDTEIKKQISSADLFEKKQECSSYNSKIEADLEGQYFGNDKIVTSYHLDEIWFSPSLNSCLYSINEMIQYPKEGQLLYAYSIKDYLSNELITHISEIPEIVNRRTALDAFEAKKVELKK